MRLLSIDSYYATLGLSRSESVLMDNVLNEFINGIHMTEGEFELRLGCGRSILRPFHDHLVDKHRSVWPDDASDPSIGYPKYLCG